LYPYIVAADHFFAQRQDRFTDYYEGAKELASLYNQCHGITTRPVVPVSNMFHIHFPLPAKSVEPILLSVYEETGVGLITRLRDKDETSSYCEVNVGDLYARVPKEVLAKAFQLMDQKLKEELVKR